MIVVEACEGVHREVTFSIESCVETSTNVTAPVTINVKWFCFSFTRIFVIDSSITNAILCKISSSPNKYALLMFHPEGVEIQVEVVSDGGLQAWVTTCDGQLIRVVSDVQQVGHAWLLSTSAIVQTQVGLLSEVIAEIKAWSNGEHATSNCCIGLKINIVQFTALWQEINAGAEVKVIGNLSETKTNSVVVIIVFRILTQPFCFIGICGTISSRVDWVMLKHIVKRTLDIIAITIESFS